VTVVFVAEDWTAGVRQENLKVTVPEPIHEQTGTNSIPVHDGDTGIGLFWASNSAIAPPFKNVIPRSPPWSNVIFLCEIIDLFSASLRPIARLFRRTGRLEADKVRDKG
jgi:hypothetical protein